MMWGISSRFGVNRLRTKYNAKEIACLAYRNIHKHDYEDDNKVLGYIFDEIRRPCVLI